ncbi:LPXTG cell wall anchor domain-containing protein [Brevibacterium oceani]|uniref:LPXTG cell wall anchor domain-containing protein n=1 Tax=Brevibacterium oceani TaxID=358099 RepID=UPI0015E63A46|nr:LPXTG cell wall anchor domain-containing protein [Brevibacterium oceani]
MVDDDGSLDGHVEDPESSRFSASIVLDAAAPTEEPDGNAADEPAGSDDPSDGAEGSAEDAGDQAGADSIGVVSAERVGSSANPGSNGSDEGHEASGDLPRTGTSSAMLVFLAVALRLIGALLVMAARRRRGDNRGPDLLRAEVAGQSGPSRAAGANG